MSTDSAFTGSIPDLYETHLVPALFAPYARDLAARLARHDGRDLIELAAGTGAVTREVAAVLGAEQRLVATDLNQAMLDVAAARLGDARVSYQAADAMALPFADHSFDLALAQFGVMFFPDRVAAHREVRRVLRPGGHYLFNVWNRLEDNLASLVVHQAVVDLVGKDAPDFIARVPFGYNDPAQIRQDLEAGGFGEVEIERVDFEQPDTVLPGLVAGMCRGSPLAAAMAAWPADLLDAVEAASQQRLADCVRRGPVTMSALVVTARRQ